MNIDEVLVNRRTIHEYAEKEVPPTLVKKALVAALHSPNHKMTLPWHFVQVGPVAREALAELGVEMKAEKAGKELSEPMKKSLLKKYLQAPELIIFCQKRCENEHQSKEDYATMACAVQNFKLSLWQDGIGTKWSTGGFITNPKTYEILNLNSNLYEIIGFIWVGYPSKIPAIINRPTLSDVLVTVP